MLFTPSRYIKPVAIALLAAAVSACASTAQTPAKPVSKAPDVALNNTDWYQVRTQSEVYVFDDFAVFTQFVQTGKAPALKPLDKKDNFGRALILGLKAEDQNLPLKDVAASRFLDVSLVPGNPFYGEIRKDGVIYVFARYGDMMDMYKTGEPTFSYTEIGGGPQGERVVYGLMKEEKKPEKQIALFHSKYPKAAQ